jgi:hypothetical protein
MSELKAHVQPFIELLETIADNKYVLGDRLIEPTIQQQNCL